MTNNKQELIAELTKENTKLGDIKKIGKEIKKDHELALSIWSTEHHNLKLLATLIFDKLLLTQDVIDYLIKDLKKIKSEQSNQICDWLLANQLMKSKKTIALLESWQNHPNPILSRLFWYHQARLRWTGQTPPNNTEALMLYLEENLESAHKTTQWTMNYCAAQIGVHQPEYRKRCIALGEKLGLYKDEKVSKNCTPSYLPEFIRIEVGKREK